MTLHRVFIGYDSRQPLAYNLCQFSIVRRSSEPVAVSPLMIDQLPIGRTGLTTFTYTRFLVPWLCGYRGWALFMDCDVMVLHDIAELFALADDKYDVMVVKNEKAYEWASVMLFNCARCTKLTPEFVDDQATRPLALTTWTRSEKIGALPVEWNHLVGYDPKRTDAKLAHFTQGTPIWPEVEGCEYELDWFRDYREMNRIEPWANIMGRSVHAAEGEDGQLTARLRLPDGGRAYDEKRRRRTLKAIPAPRFDPALSRDNPSGRYRELVALYRRMHEEGAVADGVPPDRTFDGRSLEPHIERIKALAEKHGARSILDYGAGKGRAYNGADLTRADGTAVESLEALWGVDRIALYDPGYAPHAELPEGSFDGVICTDVLEHCPEQDIGWIVGELFDRAGKFVYAAVACYPARKHLPNGDNAHVTIRPPEWWAAVFKDEAGRRPGLRWSLMMRARQADAAGNTTPVDMLVEG